MHITRSDLKTQAKKQLAPFRKPSMIATVITVFLPSLVLPSGVAPLLVDGPFAAGMGEFFLRLVRGEQPGIGSLFLGFSRFLRNIRTWLLQLVSVLAGLVLLVAPGVILGLQYSMVWFVLVDEPDLNARQALARSKALTKGHLGDLFQLAVSFLGWIGLGIITLGVGFLWVIPYIQTTWALVYEGLRVAEARKPEISN